MKASIRRKGRHYHHPDSITASALVKGRFLEPQAVAMAREWRKKELNKLSGRNILYLTPKERHLLRSLQVEFKGAQND